MPVREGLVSIKHKQIKIINVSQVADSTGIKEHVSCSF